MPVSMETSFPISISCPLLWLFLGRAMAHLYEHAEDSWPSPPAALCPPGPWLLPSRPGGTKPRPATRPFQLRTSKISCQGLKCGPSHSRAAESFEKNVSRSWEGLLRTVWLCGGGCCSAVSPPRSQGPRGSQAQLCKSQTRLSWAVAWQGWRQRKPREVPGVFCQPL